MTASRGVQDMTPSRLVDEAWEVVLTRGEALSTLRALGASERLLRSAPAQHPQPPSAKRHDEVWFRLAALALVCSGENGPVGGQPARVSAGAHQRHKAVPRDE